MAKMNCTVTIDPDDLRECIRFKAQSIQRAINSDRNSHEINAIRQRVIDDLTMAAASVNQLTLEGLEKGGEKPTRK